MGEDAGDAANGEYVLRVRMSDPSTVTATVNVIVTVIGVNEPPEFGEDVPTLLRVRENADPPVITFGNADTPVGCIAKSSSSVHVMHSLPFNFRGRASSGSYAKGTTGL